MKSRTFSRVFVVAFYISFSINLIATIVGFSFFLDIQILFSIKATQVKYFIFSKKRMDLSVWSYAIASVMIISLASFIGVFTLGFKQERLQKTLVYLVAFSAGALFGDVFLHLMPEMIEHSHDFSPTTIGLLIIVGLVIGLITEKVLHWNHCHHAHSHNHLHTFAKMNLIGDAIHNLIDGLIIGTSFLVSIPTGIATSLAILFHEIPQEIGDFAVLIHGGYSKKKALLLNFVIALSAVAGVLIALVLGHFTHDLQIVLVPIAIGMFIYIAGSDLIPEINKHNLQLKSSLLHIGFFVLGVVIMWGLLFLGHTHTH